MNNSVARMCVQTRKILPRNEMIRIVVSIEQPILDTQYTTQGRSIYIQNDIEIIEKFLNRKKLPLRLDLEKQDQVRKLLGEYINEK